VTRGQVWIKRKDYAQALTDLNRAIALDGGSIESYSTRASVYDAEGKGELAIADLRTAANLKPKNIFDALAQAAAKRQIEQLEKRVPCASGGRPNGATCL
jgi:tetratricopeptide (TPR) repeat protein